MPKRHSLAIALCSLSLSFAGLAHAERVALVRPDPKDGVLMDAFNRLRAELALHAFETELVDADVDEAPQARLAEIAKNAAALASIAFVQQGDSTSVDVWLVDRISGKTTMRRIEVGRTVDASSVLAIRAVDLLRVSLQEFEPDQAPPPDVAGVRAGPAPVAVRKLTARPEPSFGFNAELMALFNGPELGFSFGPALGIHRLFGRFELGLVLAGPLLGAEFGAERGRASVRQGLGWVDLRWRLADTNHLGFAANLGVGGHVLDAQGQPDSPLTSLSNRVFGFAAGAGAHAAWKFSSAASWQLSLQAFTLLPRAGVALLSERSELPLVLGGAATGIAVRL